MKIILSIILSFVLFLSLSVNSVEAVSRVRGYYKKSTGNYVMPHYRSTKNSYKNDNYSTKGNYNPYTGKKGYKSLY